MATLEELSSFAGGAVGGLERGQAYQQSAAQERDRVAAVERENAQYEMQQAMNEHMGKLNALMNPANQAMQEGIPMGGMGAPSSASRRDQLRQWRDTAAALASRSGGIEAMQAVEQYYDMQTQGQMFDYASRAVEALGGGSAGDAAKLLNTALEIFPADSGMEFFAENGQLYAQTPGGRRAEPYDQQELVALMESRLKTPENYLAWKQQVLNEEKADETERSNKAAEVLREGELDLNERRVAVDEERQALASEYAERDMQVGEANALANLISADARAASALAKAENNGWTPSQFLQLQRDVNKWEAENASIQLGDAALGNLRSDMTDIMSENTPQSVTMDEAAMISGLLRKPEGFDTEPYRGEDGTINDFEVGYDEETGQFAVRFRGKTVSLPEGLHGVARSMLPVEPNAALPGT